MTAAVAVGLLVLAVGALLVPRLRSVSWLFLAVLAGSAVAGGVVGAGAAEDSVRPLIAPLGFISLAVPMAVLLDRFGLFEQLATRFTAGRHVLGVLWVLAAFVTALLNLDVAVVLLSPLYVRIARRSGLSPYVVALQPALLSSLASSALPVSNLTNLIAQARDGLSVGEFVAHLALPTLVATAVGWWCYARCLPTLEAFDSASSTGIGARVEDGSRTLHGDSGGIRQAERASSDEAADLGVRSLTIGLVIVGLVIVGFVFGPSIGIEPWEVAALADLVLVVLTRSIPLAAVPWQSVVTVLGLGVLAEGAARHLGFTSLISGVSALGIVKTTAVTAVASNVVNNLPTLLVALPSTTHGSSSAIWPVLLGTNVGPLVLPSGSLALLLWSATVRRLGVDARDHDFVAIGWRIGLPSLVASGATLVALHEIFPGGH